MRAPSPAFCSSAPPPTPSALRVVSPAQHCRNVASISTPQTHAFAPHAWPRQHLLSNLHPPTQPLAENDSGMHCTSCNGLWSTHPPTHTHTHAPMSKGGECSHLMYAAAMLSNGIGPVGGAPSSPCRRQRAISLSSVIYGEAGFEHHTYSFVMLVQVCAGVCQQQLACQQVAICISMPSILGAAWLPGIVSSSTTAHLAGPQPPHATTRHLQSLFHLPQTLTQLS